MKLRPIHKAALFVDVIIGLGLIALAISAGHLGINSNIKYTLLGIGSTYFFFVLKHMAVHEKAQYCPLKYLLVDSNTEQVELQYLQRNFLNRLRRL